MYRRQSLEVIEHRPGDQEVDRNLALGCRCLELVAQRRWQPDRCGDSRLVVDPGSAHGATVVRGCHEVADLSRAQSRGYSAALVSAERCHGSTPN